MDRFETEEQQVEAIKQFWKDNGTAIIIGVVVGIGGIWGWGSYAESQTKAKELASTAYQESIQKMLENSDATAVDEFISQHQDSVYSELASLIAAQQASSEQDYDTAIAALERVAAAGGELADIANLRLSKVYFENDNIEQALSSLDNIQSFAYDDQRFELKGDLYYAKGQYDQAQSAYNRALVELPGDNNIQMKLDNIAFARANSDAKQSDDAVEDVVEDAVKDEINQGE
ncbi:MAG: tetratricopeptide repeat protein [Pseudomonadota bacterium]